jgi:hypothetical protein
MSLKKFKIERIDIESIANDAINMYVRDVLIPNNLLKTDYFNSPENEMLKLKYEICKVVSRNWEHIEMETEDL